MRFVGVSESKVDRRCWQQQRQGAGLSLSGGAVLQLALLCII